ncbi:MAG: AtpZ/AtpI family protein [Holophagaceae bacterium]|nr:AtpZ/AtpI family protein [Holophagaceae bacterium]
MSFIRPGKGGADPKERALWGDLVSLGMVFPIAIVLGWFLGKWIGGKLGHPEAGSLIGLFWGVATGFYELYKVTMRLNRKKGPGPGDGEEKNGGA